MMSRASAERDLGRFGRAPARGPGRLVRGTREQRGMSHQPRLDFEGYVAPRPEASWSPERRRDVGKAIAASNHRWQLAKAQELALEYLATHGVGIISDVRAYAASRGVALEWSKPWSANVFMLSPWFEPTGVRRKTFHKGGNARKVNEYRLTPAGRIALRERRRG